MASDNIVAMLGVVHPYYQTKNTIDECHFFDLLPREVRDLIYRELVRTRRVKWVHGTLCGGAVRVTCNVSKTFQQVSRQFKAEYWQALSRWSSVEFCVGYTNRNLLDVTDWLQNVSHMVRLQTTKVKVRVPLTSQSGDDDEAEMRLREIPHSVNELASCFPALQSLTIEYFILSPKWKRTPPAFRHKVRLLLELDWNHIDISVMQVLEVWSALKSRRPAHPPHPPSGPNKWETEVLHSTQNLVCFRGTPSDGKYSWEGLRLDHLPLETALMGVVDGGVMLINDD